MYNEIVKMMEPVLEQDKLFEIGAKVNKKALDAMIKEGFTREEAIGIIASQGAVKLG